MASVPIDAATIRRVRAQLIGDTDLAGRNLARRLSQLADSWLLSLGGDLPDGWAVVATGGYAGGVLCPGSDIDVVLLHPPKEKDDAVRQVAERLWYPLWDARIKVSPSVHSVKSMLALAADDLDTATTILRLRTIAGDASLADQLQASGLEQWRRKPLVWLQRMYEASQVRWAKYGDLASRLEPDLKDGRGGLRDYDSIRWALALDRPEVVHALELPFDDLAGPADLLLAARCELHRVTGRTANTLLLQDQDLVAENMGYADADALMLNLASAAHSIEWATERFWHRVERLQRKGGKSSRPAQGAQHAHRLPDDVPGVVVIDDEVHITAEADVDEQSFVFRVAAAAARAGYPIAARSLQLLASRGPDVGEQWTERTRRAFVSLLGSGPALVPAVEALERYDLFSRALPEWRHVRSRPQRNAFHTYTVDRHLLQAVANAAEFLREVARPDLLLVGTLLHDIGKGHPGDHTEVGVQLIGTIGPRMGFDEADVRTISSLVQHHLLLAETATRRDLSDPRTASIVAEALGDTSTLELLVALTEADSRATGPSAWSNWKADLIIELANLVAEQMRGELRMTEPRIASDRFVALRTLVNDDGWLHIEHESEGDFDVLRIASLDRAGLFAVIAGTLALHGLDVVGVDALTDQEGLAVDEFRILRSTERQVNWVKVESDLRGALAGEVDIDARLQKRLASYERSTRRALAAAAPRLEVRISNDASDTTTIVEVRAPDGLALLYRLSHALSGAGVDIRSAKVATLGHEVVDVFYVSAAHGGKLAEAEHDPLRERLRSALVSGQS